LLLLDVTSASTGMFTSVAVKEQVLLVTVHEVCADTRANGATHAEVNATTHAIHTVTRRDRWEGKPGEVIIVGVLYAVRSEFL